MAAGPLCRCGSLQMTAAFGRLAVKPTAAWLKSSDNPRTASSWQELDYEDEVPLLNWVHGTSSSDVWVGGLNGAVLHWNGSSWTDHSMDIEEAIWGVYSFPDHIIAVGGSHAGGAPLFHLDRQDESWSNHPLPSELQGLSNSSRLASSVAEKIWEQNLLSGP